MDAHAKETASVSDTTRPETPDIVSVFRNDDEPRILAAMNVGCAALLGFLVTATGLALALFKGYPSWVLQQAFVFLLAMGCFPALARFRAVRHFNEMVNGLAEFYQKNPIFLEWGISMIRLMPLMNMLVMPREWRVLVPFLVVGIPLDIGLEALKDFVLMVPKWGMAAGYGFVENVLFQALFSLLFTPYLVSMVLVLRAIYGTRRCSGPS
jgi:hypothetical protein